MICPDPDALRTSASESTFDSAEQHTFEHIAHVRMDVWQKMTSSEEFATLRQVVYEGMAKKGGYPEPLPWLN